jgi:hypothetical protein
MLLSSHGVRRLCRCEFLDWRTMLVFEAISYGMRGIGWDVVPRKPLPPHTTSFFFAADAIVVTWGGAMVMRRKVWGA